MISGPMGSLRLTRPDDWHLHLRDGAALATLVPATANWAGRAIVMPNLKPPVTTTAQAQAYRERILAHRPQGSSFEPLMTLYLTDNTPPDEIDRAVDSGVIYGVKLYPSGATTNSDSGVTNLEATYPTLERMAERGLPLLLHGEVTGHGVDIFDRERVFVEDTLAPWSSVSTPSKWCSSTSPRPRQQPSSPMPLPASARPSPLNISW